jgi:cellulose synthase/poly-beta-1,6-N-acetylglucosamine synthase-like glycosyltransferase
MIIDITKSGYQKGYLPKNGIGVFHPFFATANAAFRKEALQKTGGFDIKCETGEDIDLSIRVAKAGYELWFEPSAKITHFHRYTLKGLLKQWYNYGFRHAYLFKKHIKKRHLQFYRYNLSDKNKNTFGITSVLDIPFPVYGMIFLSSYHLMHFFLLAAVIAFLFSSSTLGIFLMMLSIFPAAWYFGIRFNSKEPFKSLLFSGIRYLADGAYVLGGLLGGIKEGVIYFEATRSRRYIKS